MILYELKPKFSRHIYTDCAEIDPNHALDIWNDLPQVTAYKLFDSLGLTEKPVGEAQPVTDPSTPQPWRRLCVCGGMQFSAKAPLDEVQVRHYEQCQKQSSSYSRATAVAPEYYSS
ncbi:MAG: hypothetical protein HRT36_06160 [Alphaproteobacteria bacterium]|nr:hypothetical protein [Alphaproteobacteria bacterium]